MRLHQSRWSRLTGPPPYQPGSRDKAYSHAMRERALRRPIPVPGLGRESDAWQNIANVIGPYPQLSGARQRQERILQNKDRLWLHSGHTSQCVKWPDASFGTGRRWSVNKSTGGSGFTR